MTLSTDITSDISKFEQWFVAEVQKGVTFFQGAEAEGEQLLEDAALDATNMFNYLVAHQSSINAVFQTALTGAQEIASIFPPAAPIVTIATAALDASTATIDAIAKNFQAGSTPLSTLQNAFSTGKAAASAVNSALVALTGSPAAPIATPAS